MTARRRKPTLSEQIAAYDMVLKFIRRRAAFHYPAEGIYDVMFAVHDAHEHLATLRAMQRKVKP